MQVEGQRLQWTLADAVSLAENAAEAVSASESPEDLAVLLGGRVEEGTIVAEYDRKRNAVTDGETPAFYRVTVSWEPEGSAGAGQLIHSTISVYGGDLLYAIDTAVTVF